VKNKVAYILLLFLVPLGMVAQEESKVSLVFLEHSETLSFDEKRLPDVQILKGDVRFRHDSALMFCDSAYFFEKQNSLHAFGHVHLLQGDSIEGFGDVLYYNGNTKMARFRKRVKLIHNDATTLTTDSLNYDRAHDIAYYFSGGMIEDSLNILTSRWGQYTPDNNQAIFRNNVKLVNPNFVLTADTLCYNTKSYQADLVGPTKIVYDKETTILSKNGWYNTSTEKSMLLDRSQIIHTDGTTLTGDTIYYDKVIGFGRVLGNMQSLDSTNQMTLYGDKGEIWEDDNHGYVTDSAMLVDWSDSAMYSYMHADTLFTEEIPFQVSKLIPQDSILVDSVWQAQKPDTLWIDTAYRQIRAYYNVRIYRENMQSVCDSMRYNGKDSILSMYGNPVCWHSENQLSADSIHIYVKDGTINYLHGIGNTIAIKREGAEEFNQLAGKEMIAYVKDGDVYLVDVQGNAETIFYPREEDGTYLGVNKTQSSFVKLYLENRQIHHVVFTTSTTGVMIPINQTTEGETKLATFFWAENERPIKPGDILLHPERTPRPDATAISASAEDEEDEEDDE
jgi:lipopolysaccharide export system protein LptA